MNAASPTTWQVADLYTLLVGLVALQAGVLLCRRIAVLGRLDIPPPVVGGVLMSLVTAAAYNVAGIDVTFATTLRDVLLLVFFVTIGLSAKLSALRAGGRPLAILCGVTVLLLVLQNVTGLLMARLFGAHPFMGLIAGSISFVGGPGTAIAWAAEAEALGVRRAPELALAAATLAVVVGALVAGPITGWLIHRRGLRGPVGAVAAPWLSPSAGRRGGRAHRAARAVMRALLLIIGAVAVGQPVNVWASHVGLVLPGFLTAMLAGVAITNIADAMGIDLEFAPIERNGEIALQVFLAISLMSLKLWTLADAVPPLLTNVAAQVVVTSAVALLCSFRCSAATTTPRSPSAASSASA